MFVCFFAERNRGSVVEGSFMVRKVPGSKSAQGQKYHVTRIVHLNKHLTCDLMGD